MIRKSLTSTVAASLILSAVFTNVALADDHSQPFPMRSSEKTIYLNDTLVSNVVGLTAKDPNTYRATTYMPIWYVLQALKKVGVTYTWDGRNLDITPAYGMIVNLTHLHPGQEDTHLSINGTLVDTAVRLTAKDPYSQVYTTYIPIWYVQYVLRHMGVQSTWDGENWNMTVHVNPIQKLGVLADSSTVANGHVDSLSVSATYANGSTKAVPVDQVTWTTSDPTNAFVSPSGRFIATNPGTYTVTANYDNAVQTVQIQVFGAVDPSQSTVKLDNYERYQANPARNGAGTLTVTLKDERGISVTGRATRLTASTSISSVSIGSFTESAPGTYTAQVIAKSSQSHVSITVKYSTITIGTAGPFDS